MINKKNIIILLTVIVVLIAATVFVLQWSGTSNQNSDDGFSNETISIFKGEPDNITAINVVMPDEVIDFVKTDDEWQIKGVNTDIKNYMITTLVANVANINAKNVIEENSQQLSVYGLDKPGYVLNAYFGDELKTFYCGNATATGDAYYFMAHNNNTVYTIYSSTFYSIFADTNSYREIPDFNVDIQTVCGVKVQKQDYTLNLQLMDKPQVINDYNVATWEMTSPSYHTIDDSRLATYVMEVLSQISVNDYVTDKGNYSDYGLNKPYAVITVTHTDGSSQKIKLGNSNKNEYYVLIDDDKTVYTSSINGYSFVDCDPFILINKFIYLESVDNVSHITFKTQDKTYKISNDNKKYYINDKEVSEDEYKVDLYPQAIGLLYTGFCSDAKYNKPVITVEYVLNDGSSTVVELVEYDARNYAVYKNSKCEFVILKKNVSSLIEMYDEFLKNN